MDQLVSLALLAAAAVGEFETAILVPLVMEIGHFFEERSILGARAAIEGLKTLRPNTAARLGARGEEAVAVEDLRLGDHDRRPAWRGVSGGWSGRARPLGRGPEHDDGRGRGRGGLPGSQVFAGTLNLSGVLEVEVTDLAEATVLGRIVELLRAAEQAKAPLVQLIEQYAEYYLPAVLLVGGRRPGLSLRISPEPIAILVVSCPCALVLASPSAMTAALAVASRLGVLIKSPRVLERLGTSTR